MDKKDSYYVSLCRKVGLEPSPCCAALKRSGNRCKLEISRGLIPEKSSSQVKIRHEAIYTQRSEFESDERTWEHGCVPRRHLRNWHLKEPTLMWPIRCVNDFVKIEVARF